MYTLLVALGLRRPCMIDTAHLQAVVDHLVASPSSRIIPDAEDMSRIVIVHRTGDVTLTLSNWVDGSDGVHYAFATTVAFMPNGAIRVNSAKECATKVTALANFFTASGR